MLNLPLGKAHFNANQIFKEKTLSGISKVDSQFLQQFSHFIKQNYQRQEFGMTQLTKEFGLSRTQLFRKTKALLGQSVSDYIQEVRLTEAKRLLLENNLSISEIAYKVGYTSPSYFSTPSKFRTG